MPNQLYRAKALAINPHLIYVHLPNEEKFLMCQHFVIDTNEAQYIQHAHIHFKIAGAGNSAKHAWRCAYMSEVRSGYMLAKAETK